MSAQPDLGPPTTLVLVRHGHTELTGRDFSGGPEADPDLDGDGRQQAELVAGRLEEDYTGPYAEPVTALIVSPYARTRQTSEPIAEYLELEAVVDADWREVESLEPEGLAALTARMTGAVAAVLRAHPGETVAVVTHAGPIRAVLTAALAAGDEALWRLRVDPASLSVVRYWADGGIEVAAVNDTAHLR
ncbi:histidine phosphatase family protein [Spongisporangium articulatum]|uniref:Histidine phosphatase family protein n=1 Tax=Spongisporangium articulatum TaxID=3362603 RepID=A0ABW8ALP6_9ACTN